jgi:hypothetical protein
VARRRRCRVGDVAILVRCRQASNVGKLVFVEARAAAAPYCMKDPSVHTRLDWFIRSAGKPFVYSEEPYLWNVTAFVSDSSLVPLRPKGRESLTVRPRRKPQSTEVSNG